MQFFSLERNQEKICKEIVAFSHFIFQAPIANMASHVYKMAVHKVKEVETMANYYENTPKYAVWRPKMIRSAFIWVGLVPYATWKLLMPFYVRIISCSNLFHSNYATTRSHIHFKANLTSTTSLFRILWPSLTLFNPIYRISKRK